MSIQHAPTAPTARQGECASLAVPRRRLLLARGIWAALVVLTLATSLDSFPAYLAQLQILCAGTACEYQQLTPTQVTVLAGVGLSLTAYAVLTVTFLLAGLAVCWAVSALIMWRRSDEWLAFLVALMLVTLGPLPVSTALPASQLPWRAPHDYLIALAQILLVIVFFLFPGGRFAPRWTRWIFVALLIGQVMAFFLPDALLLPYTVASQPGWLVALAEMAVVAGVQVYRYRRVSSPLDRQQTKWVVLGLAMPIGAFVSFTVLSVGLPALAESNAAYVLTFNEFEFVLPLLLPLSFGFAILRYRLWDIDALINRTLVYGTLTLILTVVFVGLVIGLQAVLSGIGVIGQDNGVAIVLSTLIIAALVQPMRKRLQALIDRRFYRRKYDAAKTLEAFSATLRQEVNLEQLHAQVLAVAQETIQPVHVSLWLRRLQPEAGGGGTAHNRLQA